MKNQHQMTPWYPERITPARPGVYRTSRESIKTLGSSYSRWDGQKWVAHGRRGCYHNTYGFIWRGLKASYAARARRSTVGICVAPALEHGWELPR